MKSVGVSDPAGRSWRVEVRWLPWAPRWRGPRRERTKDDRDPRWYDWIDLGEPLTWFDDALGGFVSAIVAIMLLVVLALLILPVFVFLAEVLIIFFVLVAATVARIVLRRPWLVDAYPTADRTAHLTWKVTGVGRAKATVDLVAQQLAAGIEVPQVAGVELARGATTARPHGTR